MKKIIGLLAFTLASFGMNAQSVIGAWEAYHTSETAKNSKALLFFLMAIKYSPPMRQLQANSFIPMEAHGHYREIR
jgi:hypothetical protein